LMPPTTLQCSAKTLTEAKSMGYPISDFHSPILWTM
jgi:hypothetical protein